MQQTIDLPGNALVALTRDSLIALRAAMFRDIGLNAASLLQEAGYAGGPALYEAFSKWLAAHGGSSPDAIEASEFSAKATQFFKEAGWGSVEVGSLQSVATVDSSDWAESDPAHPMEYPGCYYTSGVLADFFTRLAGEPLAVMEVECRSTGAERCRFLIASGEVMQHVYDAMGNGLAYDAAVASVGAEG